MAAGGRFFAVSKESNLAVSSCSWSRMRAMFLFAGTQPCPGQSRNRLVEGNLASIQVATCSLRNLGKPLRFPFHRRLLEVFLSSNKFLTAMVNSTRSTSSSSVSSFPPQKSLWSILSLSQRFPLYASMTDRQDNSPLTDPTGNRHSPRGPNPEATKSTSLPSAAKYSSSNNEGKPLEMMPAFKTDL